MDQQNKQQEKKPKGGINIFLIYLLLIGGIILLQFIDFKPSVIEINQNQFEQLLSEKYISHIDIVNNEYALIHLYPEKMNEAIKLLKLPSNTKLRKPGPQFKIYVSENFEKRYYELTENLELNEKPTLKIIKKRNIWGDILSWIIPFGLLLFFWFLLMRPMTSSNNNIFNFGRSKAKLVDSENIKVTFKDVAGLQEAKQEVMEIVDFLKNPDKYTKLGGKIPKGVLLVGPPGSGKTLLARAVAGEAQVPFFSLSGSDFVEMFVGVGASRVRDLFAQAKAKAPCIIFIDEIDAIGRIRSRRASITGNDERENTLNQLLTEMDGFETNTGLIIMAATNRADILDPALMRAGRFDRQIILELPELKEREEIFAVHTRNLKLHPSVDLSLLAKQTPGFSGADIANACNEAALIAARKNKENIDMEDFHDAIDKIIGGLEKRSKVIKPEEKKRIAYHECGHATVSWFLKHAQPLIKVSIVPRGKSLGAAWYLPEERQLTTKEQFYDEICSILGGRAAEEIFFGDVSSGALNDLERVTKQAYAMIVYFGMSKNLPNISFYDSSGQEYIFTKPYSEFTAQLIDQEVKEIINEQYERAKQVILSNKENFINLANTLLEKEVIFTEDVEKILGPRPFSAESQDSSKNDKEYLEN